MYPNRKLKSSPYKYRIINYILYNHNHNPNPNTYIANRGNKKNYQKCHFSFF